MRGICDTRNFSKRAGRGARWFIFCALLFTFIQSGLVVNSCDAQSSLDIRGSFSLRISKTRVIFKLGEIANSDSSPARSGQLELSVWLSRKPFDETQGIRGTRIAKCQLAGIVGGETMTNISCQGTLRPIARGRYYIIVGLSELDATTNTFVLRDQYTFSKRLSL